VEGTVKAHLTNIFAKLGVADRTQAITIAIKRQIIQLE
jgi:two-component system NarL family response regulator